MAAPTVSYTYAAICLRVPDGDSLFTDIDEGFGHHTRQQLRLNGIDCPEDVTTPEGKAARAYVHDQVFTRRGDPEPLIIRSHKDGNRWLADIWVGDESLADLLRTAGHAK